MRSDTKLLVIGLVVIIAISAVFIGLTLTTDINDPAEQLKTVCSGAPPAEITEVRGTYFYMCRDGETGYVS